MTGACGQQDNKTYECQSFHHCFLSSNLSSPRTAVPQDGAALLELHDAEQVLQSLMSKCLGSSAGCVRARQCPTIPLQQARRSAHTRQMGYGVVINSRSLIRLSGGPVLHPGWRGTAQPAEHRPCASKASGRQNRRRSPVSTPPNRSLRSAPSSAGWCCCCWVHPVDQHRADNQTLLLLPALRVGVNACRQVEKPTAVSAANSAPSGNASVTLLHRDNPHYRHLSERARRGNPPALKSPKAFGRAGMDRKTCDKNKTGHP